MSTILLGLEGEKDYIRVKPAPGRTRVTDGICHIRVKSCDLDWAGASFDLRGLNATFRIEDDNFVFEFPDRASRTRFHYWMSDFIEKNSMKDFFPTLNLKHGRRDQN